VIDDEVRIGEEAVDAFGVEALLRMEDEPRRVLLQQLRRRRECRRRRRGKGERGNSEGYPGVE
jgi:hypothetical protein